MAVINPTYVYTSGTVFDPDEHNLNLYSETSGRGIISESNGGLDSNNLNAGFKVQDHHIAPETLVRARHDFGRDTVDYFTEPVAIGPDTPNYDVRNVASCGVRFYVPFSGMIVFNVQFFVDYFRLYFGSSDQEQPTPDIEFGKLRYWLSIDDGTGPVRANATIRSLPCSAWVDNSDSTLSVFEQHMPYAINMHHTVRGQTPGWFDVQLRLQAEADPGKYVQEIERTLTGDGTGTAPTRKIDHQVYSRATFGVRNATALALMGA